MNIAHRLNITLPTFRETLRLGSSLLMVVGQRVPFIKPCATLFLETQSSRNLIQLAVPLGVTYVGTHSLSGASVAVTPAGGSKNPAVAPLGQSFSWFCQSSGSHTFNSYTVTGLPPGLTFTYGKPIASITGKATTLGSYDVQLVGWENSNKSGRKSPTYQLKIQVAEAKPEIAVEQPTRTNLVDGVSDRAFGTTAIKSSGISKTFKITNTGLTGLTGLKVSISGANRRDFSFTAPKATKLASGASTTFTVRFKPTAAGRRSAALAILSNDKDESPFDITLGGTGVK
jgi:hypothetical protein